MAELSVVGDGDKESPPIPPANVEAEMGLLGAVLINNAAFERVAGFLEAEHFSEPFHRHIWRACKTLIERGERADPVTLKQYFDSAYREIGGAAYVARLAASATTVINAVDYGRVILDLHLRRELIEFSAEVSRGAYESDLDVGAGDQIETARRALDGLAEAVTGPATSTVPIGEAAKDAISAAETAFQSDGALLGVPTGIGAVDRHLSGLQAPDLVIVGARPSMGKTALAMTVAHAVARAGHRVGIVSLEMSAKQLGTRLLAAETGIAAARIRTGRLGPDDFSTLMSGQHRLDELPIVIDDKGGLTMDQIRAFGRRLVRKQLGLLVVDHLGLVRPARQMRGQNRVAHISHVSAELKVLAKELGCPVLALSQLSRGEKERRSQRPYLSDLRDSGSIEQDADIVILLHRDEYYHQHDKPDEDDPGYAAWREKQAQVEGKADIIVAKNRDGGTRTHRVRWDAETMTFADKGDLL